jgi:hypothetical protein
MREILYLTWLNYLSGFEYWPFVSYIDHQIAVNETGETKKNVFAGWPKSYGPNADTVTKQTFRRTKKQKVIRTQTYTREQAMEIGEQLKSSPLVQLISSRRNRRTVIVDSDSIVVVKGSNKIHTLSFTITYTDDYPTQHV